MISFKNLYWFFWLWASLLWSKELDYFGDGGDDDSDISLKSLKGKKQDRSWRNYFGDVDSDISWNRSRLSYFHNFVFED